MKIVLPQFDDKPRTVSVWLDRHNIEFKFSPVISFKADKDNPLRGTATLLSPDGKGYQESITFRSPDEYPKKDTEVLLVFETIPAVELVAKGFLEILSVEDGKTFSEAALRAERETIPCATIVNGVSYIAKRFEKFVHPIVLEMFKDAERV